MTDPLPLGSTIGILGGGQLGRMLSVAAARLGYKTHIFEPGAEPPAGQVADRVTTAPYEDLEALAAFAAEYNASWLRERHGYKTPDQIRAEQKTLEPEAATGVKMAG